MLRKICLIGELAIPDARKVSSGSQIRDNLSGSLKRLRDYVLNVINKWVRILRQMVIFPNYGISHWICISASCSLRVWSTFQAFWSDQKPNVATFVAFGAHNLCIVGQAKSHWAVNSTPAGIETETEVEARSFHKSQTDDDDENS